MPQSLRSQIISCTHGEIIEKLEFFKDKEHDFLIIVMPELKPLKLNVGALAEGHAVCDTTKNFGPAITFEIDFCKMVFKINTHSPRFRW